MSLSHIVVRGAREHNLKGLDVALPRDSLIVITGLPIAAQTASTMVDRVMPLPKGTRLFLIGRRPAAIATGRSRSVRPQGLGRRRKGRAAWIALCAMGCRLRAAALSG